jgi:hypothetical protein
VAHLSRSFVATLKRNLVHIAEKNYAGCHYFCQEMGFEGLIVQLSLSEPLAGLIDAEERRS